MDLPVRGGQCAAGVDQTAGIAEPPVGTGFGAAVDRWPLGEASGQQPDPMTMSDVRCPAHGGPVHGFGIGSKVGVATGHRKVLGEHYQLGTVPGGPVDQFSRGIQVGVEICGGGRLDGRHSHGDMVGQPSGTMTAQAEVGTAIEAATEKQPRRIEPSCPSETQTLSAVPSGWKASATASSTTS